MVCVLVATKQLLIDKDEDGRWEEGNGNVRRKMRKGKTKFNVYKKRK